ncbi:uncharacterized protein LOC100366796 isoform X2 [Saccoglossus kowalevskii]|uniref:Uncharacterized protein LOC100366796 n=1 Tax=Saccoglossus kowalevskii TaxID=10224 RepID=A0ABM0LZW7_SACKO|nr:PREDICTED: uncharacterized protein LOC100366796 [Saccoglossus kowalevskii]
MAGSKTDYNRFDDSVQEEAPPSPGLLRTESDGAQSVNTDHDVKRVRIDSTTEADTEYTDSANEKLLPQKGAKKGNQSVAKKQRRDPRQLRRPPPQEHDGPPALQEVYSAFGKSVTSRNYAVVTVSPPSSPTVKTLPYPRPTIPLEDPPPDYLCCSIFSCFFFCWIIGLFAIHQSWLSRQAAKAGDRMVAEESGRYALQLTWAGIFLGVILAILFVVVFVTPHFAKT